MAEYPPPTFNSSIFNSGAFYTDNNYLTIDDADKNYLKIDNPVYAGALSGNGNIKTTLGEVSAYLDLNVHNDINTLITSSTISNLYGINLHHTGATNGSLIGTGIAFNNNTALNVVPQAAIHLNRISATYGQLILSSRNGATLTESLKLDANLATFGSGSGTITCGAVNCNIINNSSTLKLQTSSTDRVIINSGGYVTINGAAQSSYHLQVNGEINAVTRLSAANFVYLNDSGTSYGRLIFNWTWSNYGAIGAYAGSQGIFLGITNSVGALLSYANTYGGSYSNVSDYRIKENVTNLNYGLNEILQLRPVIYNHTKEYNPDDDNKYLGFIAHEVDDILTEAVTGEKDAIEDDGKNRLQCLNYSAIIPVLVNAVKELNDKIISLQKEVDSFEVIN
jgi:hypothetical protein